jgi:hypothetical protein
MTLSERIAAWPSTHVNLISSWVILVISVIISWVVVIKNVNINEAVYYFLMGAIFAWAGISAPATLIGKRATEKPEMRKTTVVDMGPPASTTTIEETKGVGDKVPAKSELLPVPQVTDPDKDDGLL